MGNLQLFVGNAHTPCYLYKNCTITDENLSTGIKKTVLTLNLAKSTYDSKITARNCFL